jgi:biotin synthase-related radical SAM superfamily protein
MKPLFIKATEETPEINFDFNAGTYSIKGVSIPENALHFYSHLIESMNNFYQTNTVTHKAKIEIIIEYFNSASGKMLVDFFNNVSNLFKRYRVESEIIWLLDQDGEDMIDFIETIEEIANLKIIRNYIS